jgi:hypothetical protein
MQIKFGETRVEGPEYFCNIPGMLTKATLSDGTDFTAKAPLAH